MSGRGSRGFGVEQLGWTVAVVLGVACGYLIGLLADKKSGLADISSLKMHVPPTVDSPEDYRERQTSESARTTRAPDARDNFDAALLPGPKSENRGLSLQESFGLIDEPDSSWMIRKSIHQKQMAKETKIGHNMDGWSGKTWFMHHYHPTFSCSFERRIGTNSENAKWVCDPHRLTIQAASLAQQQKGCLIYSIGSDGNTDFEEAVHSEITSACEIHVFDMHPWSKYNKERPPPKIVNYHEEKIGKNNGPVELVQRLGHAGKTIQLLKIDCEGCEFEAYSSLAGSGIDIRQILIEVHLDKWNPNVHSLFKHLFDIGYVVFHKEPNTVTEGDCQEYSFLKLETSFANLDTPATPT